MAVESFWFQSNCVLMALCGVWQMLHKPTCKPEMGTSAPVPLQSCALPRMPAPGAGLPAANTVALTNTSANVLVRRIHLLFFMCAPLNMLNLE
ncbi:MAG: hypothetical protein COW39_10790 [Comamonadaceae bacterium CG17_big_fil_post_rev_8_21_14_2_50_60_13]|nr:MAG: hypothetical protein COW39_10790 [Comamonadaceae bacterium CG17_big_fil_post_rev_8_21_14_2_50_60_13]